MYEADPKKYLLPVVTSYIKQGMVDAALKRVQELSGTFFNILYLSPNERKEFLFCFDRGIVERSGTEVHGRFG